MDKSKFNQVIDLMKNDGNSDQQVGEFLAELSNVLTQKVFVDVFSEFDEEDLKKIARASSPQQANFKIRLLYLNKTGKNPDDQIQHLLDAFADKFLAEYHKPKNEQPPHTEPALANHESSEVSAPSASTPEFTIPSEPTPQNNVSDSPLSGPGHASQLHSTLH